MSNKDCDRAQSRAIILRARKARCTHTSVAVLWEMWSHADYKTGRVSNWSVRKSVYPHTIVGRALDDLRTAGMLTRERGRWYVLQRPPARVVSISKARMDRDALLARVPAHLARVIGRAWDRAASSRL